MPLLLQLMSIKAYSSHAWKQACSTRTRERPFSCCLLQVLCLCQDVQRCSEHCCRKLPQVPNDKQKVTLGITFQLMVLTPLWCWNLARPSLGVKIGKDQLVEDITNLNGTQVHLKKHMHPVQASGSQRCCTAWWACRCMLVSCHSLLIEQSRPHRGFNAWPAFAFNG